jgi:aminoglycoside adenylyltransferase-like protein
MVTVPLDQLPPVAAQAWLDLRDAAHTILDDDLTAMWGYGGTIFPERSKQLGDLDTFVVLARTPSDEAKRALERAENEIAHTRGVEWDTWYVIADDAHRADTPHHALAPERLATSWAIDRAHWHAGRYVTLFGPPPEELVPVPSWFEVEAALSRELEHLERHVLEGDDDPYEATNAIWNGSRILHALETHNVAIAKRAGGMWAVEHLPDRWHEAIHAADHAYDAQVTARHEQVLREAMAPFVAMVRERLPLVEPRAPGEPPRWGGE